MGRTFLCPVAGLLLLLVSCSSTGVPAGNPAPGDARAATDEAARPVHVALSEETRLAQTIVVTGTLAAQDQVTAAMKVPGRLQSVDVDFGARVTAGQVLARLDPGDFRLRVDQASAALKQARVRLGLDPEGADEAVDQEKTSLVRQSRAQLEDSRLTSERMQTLWNQRVIPKSQLDSAMANLQVAEGRYDDAHEEIRNRQAILQQRKSELALAQQQLEDTVLNAPVSGVVRDKLVSAGNYVNAGAPMFTVLMVNPLRLRLAVPERGANGAKLGAPVRVTMEGDTNVYTGKLVRVSPSIQEQGRTLAVEAEIPNPQGFLRPGAFATAEIVTADDKPAVFIPAAAIVSFAGLEKVISVKDGKAVEIRIKTARRDGKRVEVIDGLTAGIPVVLDPGNLIGGQPVTVVSQ